MPAGLLIEDIAKELGLNPLEFENEQLRKFEILIGWAIEVQQFKDSTDQLSLEQEQAAAASLIEMLKEDPCTSLEDSGAKYQAFDDACTKILEVFDVDENDFLAEKDFPFQMSYYQKQIEGNGLKYTKTLGVKEGASNVQEEALGQALKNIQGAYDALKGKGVFLGKKINVFNLENLENSKLDIKGILKSQLSPTKSKVAGNELEIIKFYGKVLGELASLNKNQNIQLSGDSINQLCTMLKAYLKKPELIQQMTMFDNSDLSDNLSAIIKGLDNKRLRTKVNELKGMIVKAEPGLRTWKPHEEVEFPVDRVILIGPDDLLDREVNDTIQMMYEKHKGENIVVATDEKDVVKIQAKQAKTEHPFTLQVIGHGRIEETADSKVPSANLGPYRGGSKVNPGERVAKLVNKCPLINHVRISACFSGLLKDDAKLKENPNIRERIPSGNVPGRRKFTLLMDRGQKLEGHYFNLESAAVKCWNKLNTADREISLTVAPGIVEADKDDKHVVWKKSSHSRYDQVKDFNITTREGPKAKKK